MPPRDEWRDEDDDEDEWGDVGEWGDDDDWHDEDDEEDDEEAQEKAVVSQPYPRMDSAKTQHAEGSSLWDAIRFLIVVIIIVFLLGIASSIDWNSSNGVSDADRYERSEMGGP
jgi:hypothetical protein